ncbi:unnamed protein product [Ceratitis capitata]|uniref:(Mediterranean fruit fly) hypothetical protein n=1 Tax=Ceratitis capitata TaxID=7213 RepID=A0A811UZH7_CERCA|nr:unnamed protein product [Ceratitis capitata]
MPHATTPTQQMRDNHEITEITVKTTAKSSVLHEEAKYAPKLSLLQPQCCMASQNKKTKTATTTNCNYSITATHNNRRRRHIKSATRCNNARMRLWQVVIIRLRVG